MKNDANLVKIYFYSTKNSKFGEIFIIHDDYIKLLFPYFLHPKCLSDSPNLHFKITDDLINNQYHILFLDIDELTIKLKFDEFIRHLKQEIRNYKKFNTSEYKKYIERRQNAIEIEFYGLSKNTILETLYLPSNIEVKSFTLFLIKNYKVDLKAASTFYLKCLKTKYNMIDLDFFDTTLIDNLKKIYKNDKEYQEAIKDMIRNIKHNFLAQNKSSNINNC